MQRHENDPAGARRRGGCGDERGSILVLSAFGLVLALIAGSLSIDIGFLAQDARQDQKVADLASMDAVRVLPTDPTAAAQASATRNGFPYTAAGYSLVVEWGPSTTGPFTTVVANLAGATAVRVTATSTHTNSLPFVGAGRAVTRKAVAKLQTFAGFSLGSSLVNISSSSSTLLNPLVGQALGGTVNLSLVSWQGVAAGNVSVSGLQTQLASLGLSVGSVSQLLSANLTLAQLYGATASALTLQGDTADASVFNTLKLAATSAATVSLGQLLTIGQGSDNAVLNGSLNLLQLITGSAEAANGSHALAITNTGLTVPGVSSTGISLTAIESLQTYVGPVGGSVTTSQVNLTVTPKLNLDVTVGLSLVHVTGDLPVKLTLAGATGTLKAASCSGITVTVDPQALAGVAQVTTLHVTTLGLVPILDMATTSLTPSVDGPASDVSFAYPSEFAPPPFSKHVGSQPIGLGSLTGFTAGTVTVLGTLPLGTTTSSIVSAVIAALPAVIGNVDSTVLTPLLTAMGLDIGGADVTALKSFLNCGVPSLAG